jgi:peptidoglycan/LPS O-acetylase OafA/YrhL
MSMMHAAGANSRTRNQVLDFIKGSLVLFMVVYHWINYFIAVDWDIYRYLRFLTPSFILITGFLISHVYLARHPADDPQLRRRLLERGAKILLLFTVLNLTAGLVISASHDVRSFFADAYAIYVTGNGRAAFDVLVPIAYFLMLSPFILRASKAFRFPLPAAGAAAIACALAAYAAGVRSLNLELLAIAMLGLGVGVLPLDWIDRVVRRPGRLLTAYVLYLAAISRWNIPFPLQVIGVCLSLVLIYLVAVRWGTEGLVQRRVIELGKYSLFAYVAHIVVLQSLRLAFRSFDLRGSELLIPFVAALALTILAVELVAMARTKSDAVDRLYRVVFA